MPAMEEAPNTPRRDVILIADASAEGQTIASALRAQGFAVAFAPIERLEARVLDESPRVLLVDIDQPGARDAIERLRELPGGTDAELVCLGSRMRAAEIGAHSAAGRSFARPLDIHAIVAQIAALADPAPLDDSIVDDRGAAGIRPGETVPPGLLDDGTGTFPPAFQSAFPGAPEIAEMGASIFPPDESDGQSPPTLLPSHPMQLSPELMSLLASAEQRVLAQTPASSVPPPAVAAEEEMDLVLADEFLAILEAPLDAEADSSQSDLSTTGLDPGTGPNPALGITTGSFALAEGNTTAPNPAPPSTVALEPPSVGELVLDMPPTPQPTEVTGKTASVGSTPRSSETRAVSSEAPATAWEPRPPMEATTTATRSIEPRPSSAPTPPRPPPPVIEPMIDVAPPTVFPARWTMPSGMPRFASTLGGYAPASGATPPN
ncbi:MAG TPA: hypothetical protein VM694_02010, partial [Polyangium sp.]|nr:hypothetical protein [Polyangium sp.]